MSRIRRTAALFALLVGVVTVPVGSASAVGWLPAESMPLVASDLAVDGTGNAVAVGRSGLVQVLAATRTLGGAWAGPVAVSTPDDSAIQKPRVSVDARGNAVAVWSAYSASLARRVVRVANRPAGGTWGAPVRLSQRETSFGADYAIAVDEKGTVTVAWTELETDFSDVYVLRVVSRPAGGSWATAIPAVLTSSGAGDVLSPDIAVDDRGAATVAWVGSEPAAEGPGRVDVVRARTRDESWGAWTDVEDLSPGAFVRDPPQVVVDREGDSTVVWSQNDPTSVVRAVRRTVDGNWGPTRDVSAGQEPQVTVAPDGTRTAVWVSPAPGGSEVRASQDTGDGTWSPGAVLASSASDNALRSPQVAVDAGGDATAIWGRFEGPDATAEVSRRTDGGPWNDEPDLHVGALSDYPVGAIDPKGHVTLAWSTPETAPGASSVFDPVAPELRAFEVPATGVVGQPVSLSVSPRDASAVTTTWTYGDGARGADATTTHVYGAPGEYQVTVTATDVAGNESRETRSITIVPSTAPAPPYPPGPGPNPDPAPIPPTVVAPVLSGLKQNVSRWNTRRVRGSILPVGTEFSFRLDRAARVRLSFERVLDGRRAGKKCAKPTKKNRKKAKCKRFQKRGSISVAGKAGGNFIRFRGRVGGKTLPAGRYRMQATAAADGRTSKAATITFTIAR